MPSMPLIARPLMFLRNVLEKRRVDALDWGALRTCAVLNAHLRYLKTTDISVPDRRLRQHLNDIFHQLDLHPNWLSPFDSN